MQTFFDRLMQVSKSQGFKTLNDFALNGLKYESSSKLNRLKDVSKKPSVEILEDIANKFETINLHWLITGKGRMSLGENENLNTLSEPVANNITPYLKTIEILHDQIQELKNDKELFKALLLEKGGKKKSSA